MGGLKRGQVTVNWCGLIRVRLRWIGGAEKKLGVKKGWEFYALDGVGFG